MLKNGPTITATVLLSGAAAAMIALSSPAFARGGGHHQGECERYSGHECGHFDHGEHHLRGNHERPSKITIIPDISQALNIPAIKGVAHHPPAFLQRRASQTLNSYMP
jgi:hypothetical protein